MTGEAGAVAAVAAAGGPPSTVPAMGREHAIPHWVYIAVFAALAVLTVLELSVNSAVSAEPSRVSALVSLMMAKALLVVLYYMHVRYESRVLRWAIFLPFFAAVFFTVVVMV